VSDFDFRTKRKPKEAATGLPTWVGYLLTAIVSALVGAGLCVGLVYASGGAIADRKTVQVISDLKRLKNDPESNRRANEAIEKMNKSADELRKWNDELDRMNAKKK